MRKIVLYMLALMMVLTHAQAAPQAVANPALEKRVMALSEELRCLVCQNQTLADSHAELAIDLKNQVREQLAQGKSEQDVADYMVQRYGDFVLYRPPVKSSTWLLWFGPFLLLAASMLLLGLKLHRHRMQQDILQDASQDAVSESDLQRAAQLLRTDTDGKEIK